MSINKLRPRVGAVSAAISRLSNSAAALYSRFLSPYRPLYKPTYLMVEPTNYCNLSCPLCPTGKGTIGAPKGFMDLKKYKSLIDELSPQLKEIELWGFGEPMMHKDLHEMINYASRRKIHTKISTNGHFFRSRKDAERIVDSGLDAIKFSLDGASQETFEVFRKNGSFEAVVKGIRLINKCKKLRKTRKPRLTLQFIVMKHNEHEIDKIKELAKQLRMRLRLKPVSTDDTPSGSAFLPSDDRYSRYKYGMIRSASTARTQQPKLCPFPFSWAHVNWDGSVVPCCKDHHRRHLFGNAFEEGGFMKIWRSEKMIDFRRRLVLDRASLEKCRDCVLPVEMAKECYK